MSEENVENKPSEVAEPTLEPVPSPEPQPVEEPKKPSFPIFCLKLKAKVLEAIFMAIVSIVEEATFEISSEGVSLKAMDESHIAMVDFEQPKEGFEEFSVDL